MPAPAPFAPNTAANNALFPALYLYPLNDTWAPKHISLTNQHTKIGRQTSSKTAPGERNGFFDSKVLSRQHAEVWEDGGKIFIKDVKSSNGTFINGERLSSEGHESEPFELKSDDIVEFGIDIVGEDNKTIIHHKVAARVVCVFSEQDVQVAARAEQHQQQQHQQHQQQFMQQQQQPHPHQLAGPPGAPGGINGGIPGGVVNGGPQNFPFAQRRAQMGPGLGSMGGMRPPGKTGLTFDVILSRLQGEVQKSRETGAELTSLTSAMNDIHDTLGGSVPVNLPPFPAHLPPVRPPPEALPLPASTSASPEQPSEGPSSTVSAAVVVDLQSQLRDTQSSLATHLDKVRALEGVLAEQEQMKREVSTLREMMDERRREFEAQKAEAIEHDAQRPHHDGDGETPHQMLGDEVEEAERETSDEEDDDDDDARSVSTVIPHELERVDEEDEEQLAEDMKETLAHEEERQKEQVQEADPHPIAGDDTGKEAHEHAPGSEEEVEEDENLDGFLLGRPRTPEPRGFDPSFARTSTQRRGSLPFQHPASDKHTEDVYAQVYKLSVQVSSVVALTASLEAQHSTAQSTIQALETKVATLESLLKTAEEALSKASSNNAGPSSPPPPAASTSPPPPPSPPTAEESEELEAAVAVEPPPVPKSESLLEKMAVWKLAVEGQWSNVQEEWSHERERLDKAREEWEAKARQVDVGLEKMASMQTTLANQQQMIQVQLVQHASASALAGPSHISYGSLAHHLANANGDAAQQQQLKHNGGLVTPPSPRSQSSDSGGRSRRKKRRSASVGSIGSGGSGRGRSRRSSGGSVGVLSDQDQDQDQDQEDGTGDLDADSGSGSGLESSSLTDEDILAGKKHTATSVGSLGAAAAAVAARSLVTPEPSVKMGSSVHSLDSATSSPQAGKDHHHHNDHDHDPHHPLNTSTTINNADAMASLMLFFEFTQRVLLMLFWSVLSLFLVVFSGSVALFSGVWTWFLLWLVPLVPDLRTRWRGLSFPLPLPSSLSSSSSSLSLSPSSPSSSPSPSTHSQPETDSMVASKSSTITSGPNINVQAAVGVVLLSAAAAAVFWKIKPE